MFCDISPIQYHHQLIHNVGFYEGVFLDIDKFQDSTIRYCLLAPILGVLKWGFPLGLVNFVQTYLGEKSMVQPWLTMVKPWLNHAFNHG